MTKSGKQILKYAAVIFISVFILFTGITAFFLFKSEKYLNEKLPVLIAERSDGLYHLSFRKIKLNPLSFTAVIYDVKLTPDKKISVKLMEEQEYPEVVYSFSCPEFRISRINFFSLIKHRKFDCSKIRAYKPVLEISGNTIFAEDKQPFAKIFYELRPLFSDLVKEINIKNIEFVEASYGFYSSLQDSVKSADARQISLEIKNFRTDSTKIFRLNDLFDSDDIIIRMNDFSNEMGDSLHWLHVETLQYSLKHSDIHAKGFHLYPTIKDRKSNLFEVNAPELYLKSKSVARFNFKDSLEIDFLSFKNPQIKFFQKENPKKLNIEDINNFDLYGLVKNQFLKIDVDTFHLSDARLEIYRQPDSIEYQQLFKNIDVILNGFALDSTSSKNPEKLLHADNLEMTISDYHLRLEDNEHDFIADSMFISTFSNSLGARKITIMPVKSGKIPPRTEVNISCMALNLEDVNLKTLYRTRKLPTQKINVINPDVHLTYNSEIVRKKETKDPGLLFNLVTAYLRGVYADSVTVSNGKLNIRNLTHNKIQGYFETDFDFNLAGFTLDSATIRNTDKFFYASDFDLEFLDYQMKLVDDLHKINVDRISIMNLERKVEIDNLHFQPAIEDVNDSVMQSFNRSELYNIAVPKIILHGINLRNAFFYNQLNITNFYISKPKIYFENFGLLREKKEQKEFSEFYQLIFNYITDFNIAKIEIPDGELTWVNHTRKGKTISFDNQFSAALYNFRLNESELNKKRLLFSDNFEITLKDQIFQLSDSVHILKAGEVNLSSERSAIEIKDALLYPMVTAEKYNKLPTTFQVTIPQFKISNINFQNAYYSKELALSELELNNPRFQVYSQQGKAKSLDLNKYRFPLPAFIKSLKIKQFKINQAEVLTYQIKGLQQNAKSNFKVNFQIPEVLIKNDEQNHIRINTGNLITSITGFKAPIGKNHDLRIEQIDFNRNDKTIFVNQLKVNSYGKTKNDNLFSISAPKLRFSNFDLNEALKNNHFNFDIIDIENPQITINIKDSLRKNKTEIAGNLDLFPYVEPYVDQIKIQRLNFKNAIIDFNQFDKKIIDRKIDLNFKDINIAENQNTGNLLNSREFEIITTDLKRNGKNGLYEFSADSLVYNSAKHNILLKGIKINPLLKPEEFSGRIGFQTDFLKVTTDFLELAGIDESKWIDDKIVSGKKLQIGATDMYIYRNKRYPFNHNQRPPWPQELLKDIDQPFVFDSVILLPSVIKYSELMDISDTPGNLEFNKLTFTAGKISNIPDNTTKHFNIKARAELYKTAPVSLNVNFDLSSHNYYHTVSGKIGPMPFSILNNMVTKSAPISIESGQLNRFDFNLKLNDKKAEGELFFGFDDFKINVLEYNDSGAKKSKLATFWANNMMLNSKNPKGNTLLPEKITYERDVERSIINYWWKSIFTGAKQALGIKPDDNLQGVDTEN